MQTDSNMDGIHQKKGNKAKRRKTWERLTRLSVHFLSTWTVL